MKTLYLIKLLGAIVLIAFTTNSYANSKEIFKILAATGDIQIQHVEKSTDWQKASAGVKLSGTDKIKVNGISYVGLIHATGKTVEITKEGTYTMEELAKGIVLGGNGVSNKFADYMLNAVAKVDDPSNMSNYEGNMALTGSVERSMNVKVLKVFFPKTTNLISNKVVFTWYKMQDSDKYVFNLMDKYARPLYEQELSDTSISLDLAQFSMEPENCYFWNVYCKEDPKIHSEEYCLYPLSEKSKSFISDTLNILKAELGGDQSALNKVVIASYYEKNNLLNEALQNYQDAVVAAPEVDDYKKAYALFLIKMGLFDKAKLVWKKK